MCSRVYKKHARSVVMIASLTNGYFGVDQKLIVYRALCIPKEKNLCASI